MTGLAVSRSQAVRFRLSVNHLTERLPTGCYVEAAYVGLQDTAPRDALLGLHGRVEQCEPDAWADPRLIQTYSPRAAVYVLARADLGIFTLGRLPLDPDLRRQVDEGAEAICQLLAGSELRGGLPGVREACASGRLAVRWTTTALYVREVSRPDIDVDDARLELCRRHVHAFGPTTPAAFGWWAGLSLADAQAIWKRLTAERTPVDLAGHPAWILSADETMIRTAVEAPRVRFLVAPDLRLLGQDRLGLFVGPGLRRHPLFDSFHPNGVLVDGDLVGSWGRRGGRVEVRLAGRVADDVHTEMEREVASMPIPGEQMTLSISQP